LSANSGIGFVCNRKVRREFRSGFFRCSISLLKLLLLAFHPPTPGAFSLALRVATTNASCASWIVLNPTTSRLSQAKYHNDLSVTNFSHSGTASKLCVFDRGHAGGCYPQRYSMIDCLFVCVFTGVEGG
jgi:hypothetical protein